MVILYLFLLSSVIGWLMFCQVAAEGQSFNLSGYRVEQSKSNHIVSKMKFFHSRFHWPDQIRRVKEVDCEQRPLVFMERGSGGGHMALRRKEDLSRWENWPFCALQFADNGFTCPQKDCQINQSFDLVLSSSMSIEPNPSNIMLSCSTM